jgi:hypothetical protein
MLRRSVFWCVIALALLLPTGGSMPQAARAQQVSPSSTPKAILAPRPTATSEPLAVEIAVDVRAKSKAISPLIFGSNLPVWLRKEQFEDEVFRARIRASGITILRIPGGSWGDEYGFYSCETGQDQPGAYPCKYPWAARPTDLINVIRAVGVQAAYIMNVNYTAQEAAAAVAFYNGRLGDRRRIGLDRNGVDWKTVDDWARLRAAGGNPTPLGIKLWEIGNEVYGGKANSEHKGCTKANGWEETWTCDGAAYMLGNEKHDGALALIAAMRRVDPAIKVGVVGGASFVAQDGWTRSVFSNGIERVDFVALHPYLPYYIDGNVKRETDYVISQPQRHWRKVREELDWAFRDFAGGKRRPLFVNEYGLIPPFNERDSRNYMNTHVDALFQADSLGQMIQNNVDMAAQWALMNGRSDNYGNELTASAVDSTASAWNGLFSPADDLSDAPAAQLPAAKGQTLSYVLKPFAITLLTLTYR